MSNKTKDIPVSAVRHFVRRASRYNRSSHWVDDPVLIEKIRAMAGAGPRAAVLDIAIGTGKIAHAFRGRCRRVVGVDICPQMFRQARRCADTIVQADAQCLPFRDNSFDVCVCRQGLQFMRLSEVFREIHRVLRPGGRFVMCHLTAYGAQDKKEAFLIQKLRNPARKNFFLPEDFDALCRKNGFADTRTREYITRESVGMWTNNGAISETARARIRAVYEKASEDFKRIHSVRFTKHDIFDAMKMVIVRAAK